MNPRFDVEIIIFVSDLELVDHFLRDHFDESRIEFLSKWHYEVEDLSSETFSVVVIVSMLILMVVHGQMHVLVVHLWIFCHKINIYLLLFSVLKHLLSESLEILSQIASFLQLIFNFIYKFLWIYAEFKIKRGVEKLMTCGSQLRLKVA